MSSSFHEEEEVLRAVSSSAALSSQSASPGNAANANPTFFADATLDLATAHDLAETPEAVSRPTLEYQSSRDIPSALSMPPLNETSRSLHTREGREIMRAITSRSNSRSSSVEDSPVRQRPASVNNTPSSMRSMTRLTGFDTEAALPGLQQLTSKAPTWPRDIPYLMGFVLFVPTSLLGPLIVLKSSAKEHVSPLSQPPFSVATLHTLWWAAVATLLLYRVLYRTVAGGPGDDARHVLSQWLVVTAPLSVLVYVGLCGQILLHGGTARAAVLIPAWYCIRDVFLFRRWKQRPTSTRDGSTGGGSSSSTSRQAFFQVLVNMGLDLLSRSLRRIALMRVMTILLATQVGVLVLWRAAMLRALAAGSWTWLTAAAVGGKWATGTVSRLLSLLASGGVASWFVQQSALLENVPEFNNVHVQRQRRPARQQRRSESTSDDEGGAAAVSDDDASYQSDTGSMPEAYRTVDASVYQSVLDMDDAYDDDDLSDQDDMENGGAGARNTGSPSPRGVLAAHNSTTTQVKTAKALMAQGLSVSFGSVAQCGLLGGPAQFVWSQVRKVQVAQDVIARVRHHSGDRDEQLQSMAIGNHDDANASLLHKCMAQGNGRARDFVRNHSDLAMSHVALYYKNYRKAARDVARLVDQAGVEPIIHDDITTHICACVGGSISGLIVIFTGYVLIFQRESTKVPHSDWDVIQTMLLAFVLSYTLIFTAMEPLRASIKAAYVSFAQDPRSLSQAYPLIYHRLTRLSESNLS